MPPISIPISIRLVFVRSYIELEMVPVGRHVFFLKIIGWKIETGLTLIPIRIRTGLKRIRPEETFADIGRDEHLIALAHANKAAEFPELFASFRPLFGFIGRCDGNSQFGVGSGLVKGDFAVSFDQNVMAISKDNPSITNLAGVVASNFFEPQGFVQSWNPIEIPNANVSHVVLISKSDNSIICRGTLDVTSRLGSQDKSRQSDRMPRK